MKVIIKKIFFTAYSILQIIKHHQKTQIPLAINNKECIILGNGPSLKDELENNLDYYKNSSCKFSVNDMALDSYYEVLQPQYYVLADPAYFDKNTSEIVGDNRDRLIMAIKEKTFWNMTIFIPALQKGKSNKFLSELKNKNNIKVCFYNSLPIKGFTKFKYFCLKKNFASPYIQNVLVAAIYLAINMGFENIYLVGADHSWIENITVNDDNVLLQSDKHFYGKISSLKPIYKDSTELSPFNMHEFMWAMYKVFYEYHVLQQYAEYLSVHIYNCSEKSYIDAFERRRLS